jgi:altronate hydrolase
MAIYELKEKAIRLRDGDDVAVARETLAAGTVLSDENGGEVRLSREIPVGHKIALRRVREGDPARKYGQVIGYATADVQPGDWVHTHNLGVGPLQLAYEFGTEIRDLHPSPHASRTFMGYARKDGRVGTRNTVLLLSSVNCSADTIHRIARRLREETLPDFPNVDDVVAITHKTGCGMVSVGPDYELLQRTLAGFADHPNVANTLIIGLGCEVNQPLALAANQGLIPPQALTSNWKNSGDLPGILKIQEVGGVRKTVEAGFREGLNLLRRANEHHRTPQPISKLVVGTNCGGSDAYSGITANPAMGIAGDELVACGGTWVLAETSETYGAEHLLTKRAVSREVGEKLLALMRWWEEYTAMHGAEIDNNPAPGNKAGGLTTIYEKSLGAAMKGGTAPLRAVYGFAERITESGFCFMDTPGHDPVSVTGLVAGGCNLVAFSTGRGSCLGFKPTPVLKIATNSRMYETLDEDMDINAGVIMDGVPMEDVAAEIFEKLVAMAGGEKSKSEAQGLGDETFAPWTLGPVL